MVLFSASWISSELNYLAEPFPLLRSLLGPPRYFAKHALQESVHLRGPDGNLWWFLYLGTNTDPRQLVSNGPYQIASC